MIFVELACGIRPVTVQGDMEFSGTDQYIGIDRDYDRLYGDYGAEDRTNRRKPYINAEFLHWIGEDLPVITDTVDETFLGNVLTHPGKNMSSALLRRMLDETHRILNDTG